MTVNDSVPWRGVEIKWLAHADIGAQFGAALLVNVPAGAAYEVHRHREVERVVYVLAGSGKHRGGGGTVAVVRDDALVLSPGTWHGFENDRGSAARLVILYAPHTRFPHHDYECTDRRRTSGAKSPFTSCMTSPSVLRSPRLNAASTISGLPGMALPAPRQSSSAARSSRLEAVTACTDTPKPMKGFMCFRATGII